MFELIMDTLKGTNYNANSLYPRQQYSFGHCVINTAATSRMPSQSAAVWYYFRLMKDNIFTVHSLIENLKMYKDRLNVQISVQYVQSLKWVWQQFVSD